MDERQSPSAERLSALERQIEEHNRRLNVLEKRDEYTDARLIALETGEQKRRLDEAREEERAKSTDLWRSAVEANFKDQRERNAKLFWIIVGSVLAAFVGFVMKGGLSLP